MRMNEILLFGPKIVYIFTKNFYRFKKKETVESIPKAYQKQKFTIQPFTTYQRAIFQQ